MTSEWWHPNPNFHHPYCQFFRSAGNGNCTCVEGRAAGRGHNVYAGGPACSDECPGIPSEFHSGYAVGYLDGARTAVTV